LASVNYFRSLPAEELCGKMKKPKDFFMELQKIAQDPENNTEIFIDENGEVEFEIDAVDFLNTLKEWTQQDNEE
jgi:hypothetical protein